MQSECRKLCHQTDETSAARIRLAENRALRASAKIGGQISCENITSYEGAQCMNITLSLSSLTLALFLPDGNVINQWWQITLELGGGDDGGTVI